MGGYHTRYFTSRTGSGDTQRAASGPTPTQVVAGSLTASSAVDSVDIRKAPLVDPVDEMVEEDDLDRERRSVVLLFLFGGDCFAVRPMRILLSELTSRRRDGHDGHDEQLPDDAAAWLDCEKMPRTMELNASRLPSPGGYI